MPTGQLSPDKVKVVRDEDELAVSTSLLDARPHHLLEKLKAGRGHVGWGGAVEALEQLLNLLRPANACGYSVGYANSGRVQGQSQRQLTHSPSSRVMNPGLRCLAVVFRDVMLLANSRRLRVIAHLLRGMYFVHTLPCRPRPDPACPSACCPTQSSTLHAHLRHHLPQHARLLRHQADAALIAGTAR